MNPAPDLPLSGIKVLDLSRLLPGPYASLVLADLGARVDKVEEPGGAAAMPGVQIAAVGGGSLFAVVGILAALYERQRTGVGRFVDVSMTEGALAFLHMHLAAAMLTQAENPIARGREALNGGYACYNVYPTADGRYLSFSSLEPKVSARLSQRLGRPRLVTHAYAAGG